MEWSGVKARWRSPPAQSRHERRASTPWEHAREAEARHGKKREPGRGRSAAAHLTRVSASGLPLASAPHPLAHPPCPPSATRSTRPRPRCTCAPTSPPTPPRARPVRRAVRRARSSCR
jgi:hypothetical protein